MSLPLGTISQFPRRYSRRELLRLLGWGSAVCLAADGAHPLWSAAPAFGQPTAGRAVPACVVRPEQTEGPYFVDEKLNRSDIRADPSDDSVRPGVPLELEFLVSRIAGTTCEPLSGAYVDLWQCDAVGIYSDVRDSRFDARGKKFLRGYQQTDGGGRARFLTIYPGWYEGRAVHIHFKIRTAAGTGAHAFTSQIYFDESVNNEIMRQAPYSKKPGRRVLNNADFLFRRGGKDLLVSPAKTAGGYAARFAIGLQLS